MQWFLKNHTAYWNSLEGGIGNRMVGGHKQCFFFSKLFSLHEKVSHEKHCYFQRISSCGDDSTEQLVEIITKLVARSIPQKYIYITYEISSMSLEKSIMCASSSRWVTWWYVGDKIHSWTIFLLVHRYLFWRWNMD